MSAPFFLQHAGHAGRESGKLEVAAFDQFRYFHQAHQVHRTMYAIQIVRRELEFLEQQRFDLWRTVVGDFQSHGVAKMALRQLTLQAEPQIFDLFLVHEQIAVARHPELEAAKHFHAAEQFADMRVQNRRKKNEAVFASAYFRRQQNRARQYTRGLHDSAG
jgi:hypothetical protein